jgi:hypothetical protein
MSEKPTSTAMKTQPSGMAKYASTYAAHWRWRPLMRLIATADLPERLAHGQPARHIAGMDDPKIRLYPDESGLGIGSCCLRGKGLPMAGRRARKRSPSRLPDVPLRGRGSAGPIDKRTLRQQSPNGPRQRDPNRDEGREL